jgi:hypothetical protein
MLSDCCYPDSPSKAAQELFHHGTNGAADRILRILLVTRIAHRLHIGPHQREPRRAADRLVLAWNHREWYSLRPRSLWAGNAPVIKAAN